MMIIKKIKIKRIEYKKMKKMFEHVTFDMITIMMNDVLLTVVWKRFEIWWNIR